MSEVTFPIILTAALLAVPTLEVLKKPPLPVSQVEVETNTIDLPSAAEGESFDIVFSASSAPNVNAIKARLASVALEVPPVFPTSLSQGIQALDASHRNPDISARGEFSPAENDLQASSSELWEVSASVLNMRSGPSSKNPIVGTLTLGERAVAVGDSQGGWMPVRSAATDTEGWVRSLYLRALNGT